MWHNNQAQYRCTKVLNDEGLYTFRAIPNSALIYDGVTEAEKFDMLTGPILPSANFSPDQSYSVSTGPFNLGPGESDTAAFAVIAATSLDRLRQLSMQVSEHYRTVLSLIPSIKVGIKDNLPSHVTESLPEFNWEAMDPAFEYQDSFEVAVGSDRDWILAEMWSPAPIASPDTFVFYSGDPLIDGQTYWSRIRVHNGLKWSQWSELMFHMNSIPTTPTQLLPLSGSEENSIQPAFVVRNSVDVDSDSLVLIFEVSLDSTMVGAHTFAGKQELDSTTTVIVDMPLTENEHYYWRVRASDHYEESPWTSIHSFWVNEANSAPSLFELSAPLDGFSPPIAERRPTFVWSPATDADPFDVVTYSFHLALDSNFNFVDVTTGIAVESFQIEEPLSWSTNCWWKVQATDQHGADTWSSQTFRFRTMTLGDADGSGAVTIADVVFLVNYIFSGGPAPAPIESGDPNCDGHHNIGDLVYLVNFIFASGAPPCIR